MNFDILERWIAPLKRRVAQSISRAVITALSDSKDFQQLQAQLLADELHSNIDRIQNYGFTSVPKVGAEGIFLSVGGSREHGVIIAVDDRRYRLKNLASGEVAMYTDEGDKIHFKRGGIIEVNASNRIDLIATSKVKVTAPDVEVDCTNAKVTASTKAEVTTPTVTLTASTKIDAITPLLNVTGLIGCAGIAMGVPPVAGEANIAGPLKVTGSVEATGDVQDANGTMQEMRGYYNSHVHSNPEGGNVGPATPQMS